MSYVFMIQIDSFFAGLRIAVNHLFKLSRATKPRTESHQETV